MHRRTFLAAFTLTAMGQAYASDAQEQVFDLFTKIAGALSDGNVSVFVEAFDPDMPQLREVRLDVTALAAVADLTNSIEVVSDKGDDTHRAEELDWFLEIVEKADSHKVERRREVVKFRLERKGKKWKIVSVEPLHFFAPPKTG